jgi:hypothetical protein
MLEDTMGGPQGPPDAFLASYALSYAFLQKVYICAIHVDFHRKTTLASVMSIVFGSQQHFLQFHSLVLKLWRNLCKLVNINLGSTHLLGGEIVKLSIGQ